MKEKIVCTFCSTLLDTWAKETSSHILLRHYRDGQCRQRFLTKLLWKVRPGVLPMTPKQNDDSSEWFGKTSPWLKKLKFQRSHIRTMLTILFDSQGVIHKEFIPEGKRINAEFYKGVMDRLLKCIQRVHPAAFCSWESSFCKIKHPPTKLQVFANFLPQKMLQPIITPSTLQIYLCQTIFCSPSWKWS